MRCKNCKKENKQIKAGKTRAGNQIYKCKHCGKRYTPNPKERSYIKEVRRQAIKLYMEGNGGRAGSKKTDENKQIYSVQLDKKFKQGNGKSKSDVEKE